MPDDLNLPARDRPLSHTLQRGHWAEADLRWLLAQHPKLPPLVRFVIDAKLKGLENVGMSEEGC